MKYSSGGAPKPRVIRESRGNVIWLTYPAREPQRRFADPAASLKESVEILAGKIKRSEALESAIAGALRSRRYELYRGSTISGGRAADGSLAMAQGVHLVSLLKFVHSIAAAGSDDPATTPKTAARMEALTSSLRELKATLGRARELSRNVLAQCRTGAASAGTPAAPADSR